MPDIKHAIQIDAPPNRVFPLVASADGFKQWWAGDVSGAETAGPIDLGFFNRSTVYRLRPNENKPPLHVSWLCESGKEWSGTRLLFDLTEQDTKTQLRFAHGRLGRRNRILHLLQHNVGRADVPPQSCRRRKISGPALHRLRTGLLARPRQSL